MDVTRRCHLQRDWSGYLIAEPPVAGFSAFGGGADSSAIRSGSEIHWREDPNFRSSMVWSVRRERLGNRIALSRSLCSCGSQWLLPTADGAPRVLERSGFARCASIYKEGKGATRSSSFVCASFSCLRVCNEVRREDAACCSATSSSRI